ncbi:uncharacterized protein LOC108902375 isoform X1 [Lates calcarifer]|uniref:Uncharacterized protein LOC108902375 isoform X1 n=1 Tax=Lates calcarifer TaxID=8187 RepID=A0AAJ8B363_LATCA|nr:uncharacterized protein LOC108902375 isoform X1 [Lates calcarifer]
MSVNLSSFVDPHLSSSNISLHSVFERCAKSRAGNMIITAFSITNVLLTLPLSVVVLYLGFRQWRPRCFASTGPRTSRADLFTYNMVAMMLIEVLASCLYCVGTYTNVSVIMSVGYNTFCICSSKKILLEMLTCVERYLAVVHPVTYRGLKNQTGIRIRNLSTGCVWLLFFLWFGLVPVTSESLNMIVSFCSLALVFIVISFCSVSVLCTLRRPGPGDEGRNRERVDHLKRRAFHTILTILGGQLLALGGVMVCFGLFFSLQLRHSDACVMIMSAVWFSLPSSLLLPLLYLHREGKLPCCTSTESD